MEKVKIPTFSGKRTEIKKFIKLCDFALILNLLVNQEEFFFRVLSKLDSETFNRITNKGISNYNDLKNELIQYFNRGQKSPMDYINLINNSRHFNSNLLTISLTDYTNLKLISKKVTKWIL